jgi:hypothetical protein
MQCGGEEESACDPSMKDLETFMRYPNQKSDEIIFPRQKNQKGKLRDGEQCGAKSKGFPMLCSLDPVIVKLKAQNKPEIPEQQDYGSKGRDSDKIGVGGSGLRIGKFADDGRDGCHELCYGIGGRGRTSPVGGSGADSITFSVS